MREHGFAHQLSPQERFEVLVKNLWFDYGWLVTTPLGVGKVCVQGYLLSLVLFGPPVFLLCEALKALGF